MKRIVIGLVGAIALLLALPSAAHAASAQVTLLHGIPGATVDVVVDGKVVIPNFAPGQTQDLSALAGQTLKNVEVRLAGKPDVVIGPVAALAVPGTGNWTLVAHLDAAGKPALTPFQNDVSPVPAGQGRLIIRHAAAAPAVDIVLGADRPVKNLANGKEAVLVLPAGAIAGAKIAPTGGDPIGDVPAVELKSGTDLVVYAVGSLDQKTFTFQTETIVLATTAPGQVGTGNSLPSADSAATWLALAAAVLGAAGLGAVLIRRRTA